jgi:hypothetical protein
MTLEHRYSQSYDQGIFYSDIFITIDWGCDL